MLFSLLLVPILLGAGVGIDLMRAGHGRRRGGERAGLLRGACDLHE